ncbi:TauD/TfdA family dioxygenase [Xenorhabdus littoralis]|nr:TauD/TfdA family dioxygenase [Xenorhabdus sp. Reich]
MQNSKVLGVDMVKSVLTIPVEIQKYFEKLPQHYDLRLNHEILRLSMEIRDLIDPHNMISDAIRKKVSDNGYVIISGFPIDGDKPETPILKIKEKPAEKFITEKILIYLSALLGNPHAYEAENDGQFIHDLYPIKGNESVASGTGSEIDLEFHTEIAFDIDKPDYLLLTAVRSREEQNVPTTLVNVSSVLACLSESEINLLQGNHYFIRAPYSFSGGDDVYYLRALVNSHGKTSYSFNFNSGVIHCRTQETKRLFEKVRELCNQYAFEAYLSPGTALIIDNNKMLHGRSLFKPKFDGKDRWLQRIYVKNKDII